MNFSFGNKYNLDGDPKGLVSKGPKKNTPESIYSCEINYMKSVLLRQHLRCPTIWRSVRTHNEYGDSKKNLTNFFILKNFFTRKLNVSEIVQFNYIFDGRKFQSSVRRNAKQIYVKYVLHCNISRSCTQCKQIQKCYR